MRTLQGTWRVAPLAILVAGWAWALNPATLAASRGYRTAVKNLRDREAAEIDWRPRPVSLALLADGHYRCYARADSVRGTSWRELYLWETTGVLVERRREKDGDLHLILASPDDASITLVAEVPDPREVPQEHRGEVAGARRVAEKLKRGACVVVRGVGFCDYEHGQRGAAPSAVELHPLTFAREVPR